MIKSLVRQAVRSAGYDLVKWSDAPEKPFDALRLAVNYVATGDGFRFVQIGANDGVTADPLRRLISRYGMTGLLVEPLPDAFERLKTNYAGVPGLVFAQCAIGPADGTIPMYRIRHDAPPAGFDEAHSAYASLDKSHFKRFGLRDIDKHVEEIAVPCMTVPSLLKEHGIDATDLLLIDTEGYDHEVLKMALAAGLRPKIIQYEFIHLAPRVRGELKHLLGSLGYSYLDVRYDTLALNDAAFGDANT